MHLAGYRLHGGGVVLVLAFASLLLFSNAGATEGKVGSLDTGSVEVDQSYLSPVDSTSLTLGSNGTFIVTNGTSSQQMNTGLDLVLSSVAWRPDGSYALIVGDNGTLIVFSKLRYGMMIIDTGTAENLTGVSWKPDGSFALITGCNGMVIRFNHDTQRCLRIPTSTTMKLKDVQWDIKGEHAEITGENGTSIIYPPILSTRPDIRITDPISGTAVAGVFRVLGTASVGSGTILGVEAKIDSGGWLPASGREMWDISFDAAPYDNGPHTVSARAWSASDEVASASVEIRFENIRLPPLVTLLSPQDCARVSGTTAIEGTAAAFSGTVERVDIRLDDFDWCRAVGTGFWKLTIDTTTLPNGAYRVQARVWDGAQFSAAARIIIIENQLTQPWSPAPRPTGGAGKVISLPPAPAPRQDAPAPPAPSPSPGVPAGAPPVAPLKDGGTITVPAVSWGMLIIAALALGTEPGKYALFQLFFVPLYSRIKKDAVLDNFTRGMIYGFIMSNPGVHYNFIKQKLGLNNGSIVYHLTVLERQELIKSEKVGLYKRFYPMGQNLSESGIMELNETQSRMLEMVRENPGLTQRELAERIGISSRVVNYHVGLLQRARLLALEKDGKLTRCFATERMPVC